MALLDTPICCERQLDTFFQSVNVGRKDRGPTGVSNPSIKFLNGEQSGWPRPFERAFEALHL